MKKIFTLVLLAAVALCACESPMQNEESQQEKPQRPENALSTLTEDIEVNFPADTSLCFADCFGDYYDTGLYMWQFYFMEFNTKEQLCIEVMVRPNDLVAPTGTFYATSDIFCEGGMLRGIVDEEAYNAYSWYIRLATSAAAAAKAPVAEGSVTITANEDGTHTATFNLQDDAYNSITGSYTGVLSIEDFRM